MIHVGGLAKKHTVLIAKGLVQECLLGATTSVGSTESALH